MMEAETKQRKTEIRAKKAGSRKVRENTLQIVLLIVAVFLLLLSFIPIILMVVLSFKSTVQIYQNFWALPDPVMWSNYNTAALALIQNMVNSLVLVAISTVSVVILASVAGYVFARLTFPGKEFLYLLILALMMIPGVLTLTPQYTLMQDLHITNTWWAVYLPWVSGGQVFGIMLCRTFIASQPAALFESARIDGCTELQAYSRIALPLAKPILATLAIMSMIGQYNDFIWPLMVIDSNTKQVITVAIRVYQSSVNGDLNIGIEMAGFVIATIPLLLLFLAGSNLYIEGITSGAVKG